MDKMYAIENTPYKRCQCFNCMYDLNEKCGNCVTCHQYSKCITICSECKNKKEKESEVKKWEK